MLYYTDEGSGKVLVCLHGFLESSRMWSPLNFGKDLRRICIDLPGHGASEFIENVEIVQMAELVEQVLDALDIKKYTVIGHSMGGYVALELLNRDPRCEGVILLNSNTWADDPQKQEDRKRVAELVLHHKKHFIYEAIPHLFWHPEIFSNELEALIQEAAMMQAEGIGAASLAMARRRDHTELVRASGNRVLLIQGANDAVVPVERMRATALHESCLYEEIEDSAHMAHIEQRTQVEAIVKKFLG